MATKTAMQQFIEWGDKMIDERPSKHLSFYEAIDKAEELLSVEREQIEKAYQAGDGDAYNLEETKKWAQQYYDETFKKE